jgi:hypothetical protein
MSRPESRGLEFGDIAPEVFPQQSGNPGSSQCSRIREDIAPMNFATLSVLNNLPMARPLHW